MHQLQEMHSQADMLNNISRFIPLSEEQESARQELETLLEMKEISDGEDHSLDSEMSEGMRQWYQDEYG